MQQYEEQLNAIAERWYTEVAMQQYPQDRLNFASACVKLGLI